MIIYELINSGTNAKNKFHTKNDKNRLLVYNILHPKVVIPITVNNITKCIAFDFIIK
ncbi:hypothetical protein Y10_18240 [Neptunitalea sp. Y10]|uniref:Uncharacterized protein n=1 Tax=Neptunitalea lumnitzerae TaxID=2965509 RepID=A0ABQ5MJ66_9FLAO|nr:hypothetical protein Y10_18240 [Neptunitalea sp. Y10]